ncbi:EnvZ/OmpR regulon moderator MzrA [Pantoea sp. 1.19]|uniref:EnvZ/OmpR regulon moderator MzrA n=1 Tax=Pantoea sp. 1.19 TaxID=1925589 RepID=UPI000B1C89FA
MRIKGLPRFLPWLLCGVLMLLAATFLPALFRDETALQIRAAHQGLSLPDGFFVYQRLSAQGIRIKSITPGSDALLVTLESQDQRAAAVSALYKVLPPGFIVAQVDAQTPAPEPNSTAGKLI